MAVEKMMMLNIVGKLEDLEGIVYETLKSQSINMVDSMNQLSKNNAIYNLNEKDIDMIVDLNGLGPFSIDRRKSQRGEEAQDLMEFFGIRKLDRKSLDFMAYKEEDFDSLYKDTSDLRQEIESINNKLRESEKIRENLHLFENVDVDLTELRDMEYFKARFGRIEKSARLRLKESYGHILATVFHTGSYENEEVYLTIYPKEVEDEIGRILNSLKWIDVPILDHASGSVKETLDRLEAESLDLKRRLEEIQKEKRNYYNKSKDKIESLIAKVLFLEELERLKSKMARSTSYFLLSGWIAENDLASIKDSLKDFDLSLTPVDISKERESYRPPTKLKNNKFFRPFEFLVRMYGTPNYNEMDPTVFLGLSYMILFGAMFGDLGQGLIFLLAGFLITRKRPGADIGEILKRLGFSSMVFGLLYGSVFGSEEIIPALWIRPFENINQVLALAIGFGVVLLLISYIFSFINAYKRRDLYDGIFGEHGLMGFVVFIMMIVILLNLLGYFSFIPNSLSLALILGAIILMIFKKPLMAKLMRKKVNYEGGKAGYFIESSFSMIELLISTLSGLVSFIRVGAFAINHVGLFLAFHTMAEMANSGFANILILILGNLLIIGLEGLIVFIQGLRLEYYELFSRYYSGDGIEFKAENIDLTNLEGEKKWS